MNTHQHGMTLPIALIMLFLMTIIGISAISVTHMQEKMSANILDKNMSFAAAESALAAGEAWILSQNTEPAVLQTCGAAPCVREYFENVDILTQPDTFWQNQAAPYTQTLSNIATPPRYIIEFMQFVPDAPVIGNSDVKSSGVYYYRVTARATGGTNDAITIIQTTVARRF